MCNFPQRRSYWNLRDVFIIIIIIFLCCQNELSSLENKNGEVNVIILQKIDEGNFVSKQNYLSRESEMYFRLNLLLSMCLFYFGFISLSSSPVKSNMCVLFTLSEKSSGLLFGFFLLLPFLLLYLLFCIGVCQQGALVLFPPVWCTGLQSSGCAT